MCEDCGCTEIIEVDKKISTSDENIAHELRHFFVDNEILCVNILGAPGSGKTTFIEGVAKHLDVAVIQGDLESDVDKKRLEEQGIPVYQINTHSGCHLTAQMIKDALNNFKVKEKYLFIENVGNLVCPAGVNIGQHITIVISATTEGSDKPKKYPIIYYDAEAIVISKYNLAKEVEFDEEQYLGDVKNINGKAKIFKTDRESDYKDIIDVIEHQREHILSHTHKH